MKDFGYPIHYDDFWELLHPNPDSPFHRPFDLGEGRTALANGHMVLVTTQAVHRDDKTAFDDSEESRRRIEILDWSFFDYPTRTDLRPGAVTGWSNRWKKLEERGAALVRPELAAWQPTIDPLRPGGFDFVSSPRVSVGEGRLVISIPLMQLVRRLPAVQVWIGNHQQFSRHGKYYRYLPVRFTHGFGFVASVLMADGLPADREGPRYGIWTPQHDAALQQLNPPR